MSLNVPWAVVEPNNSKWGAMGGIYSSRGTKVAALESSTIGWTAAMHQQGHRFNRSLTTPNLVLAFETPRKCTDALHQWGHRFNRSSLPSQKPRWQNRLQTDAKQRWWRQFNQWFAQNSISPLSNLTMYRCITPTVSQSISECRKQGTGWSDGSWTPTSVQPMESKFFQRVQFSFLWDFLLVPWFGLKKPSFGYHGLVT